MIIRTTPAPSPVVVPFLAKNPITGVVNWTVNLRTNFVEYLESHGPGWKFFNVQLVSEVLESPSVILQGLNRVGFDDAYCYSQFPPCRWVGINESKPPWPHFVFVAFVSSLSQPHVIDWEWRLADAARPGYPKNWQKDFARQVWPPTS